MSKNITKTFSASPKEIERKWYIVDATDLVLGRTAVIIADYLRGKHKPLFTPNQDCGDYIIVINAEKVYLTGQKERFKKYIHHTDFPGGLKEINVAKTRAAHPERIIEEAVKDMITRNPLGREVLRKLFVYKGPNHKHEAQKPIVLDIKSLDPKNSKRN
ncbi:MAG: 50S ribosomal protein L13 [Rickettsiales bacterium]|jgi:large subunit ribosomal protein L13|nr:50S ribosomal protein L13 [Rickettsiales bacterium]